jgi:hypothetical protein
MRARVMLAAACSTVRPAGLGTTRSAAAHAYSANAPPGKAQHLVAVADPAHVRVGRHHHARRVDDLTGDEIAAESPRSMPGGQSNGDRATVSHEIGSGPETVVTDGRLDNGTSHRGRHIMHSLGPWRRAEHSGRGCATVANRGRRPTCCARSAPVLNDRLASDFHRWYPTSA